MIHRRVHPHYVEGCGPCRWASVSFSADATPTRRVRAAQVNETERQWAKDMDAYKRIVEGGNQPNAIDGCAELEQRADHPLELAQMKVIDDPSKARKIREGNQMSADLGVPIHAA